MRIAACASLALLFVLVGCGDTQNDAPIIDYVDSPPVVSADHGLYKIPVTVGFHDNDSEVVTRVRYRLPPSVDGVVEIAKPLPTSQSAEVVLVIPAPLPGSVDGRKLEITIIDGRGAESLPQPSAITFE